MNKICFIDFDGTLVRPNGNRPFPRNAEDFRLLFPIEIIREKLMDLQNNGYRLILRSDQSKPWKYTMINTVRDLIVTGTKLEIGDIISWSKLTNKPNTKLVEQIYPLGTISPESIMIGDAAGRHGDWSSVDRDFAANLGVQFYTPEEFFSSHTITVLANKPEPNIINYTKDSGEIVLMVGLPGSGKSTFVKNQLGNYQYISGDVLKTTPKIIKAIKELYCFHGDSLRVVIDACNHTVEKRKTYIDLANQIELSIRCIWIDVAKETAIAQNELRKDTLGYLPKIAIYTIAKRFEAPSSSEGIEIITINQ